MRKIFFLIVTLILLQNCKTGIITEELKKDTIMFETFDYDKFEKENEKYIDHESSSTYIFKNGREVEVVGFDNKYHIYGIPPFPYFYLSYKEFYEHPNKSSTIKEKGKYIGDISLGSNGGVKIGYWYYFDEKGKLIHQVDEDKKFGKFDYNEVLKFLDEQKHINLKTGEGRDKVRIDFFYSDKSVKKLWYIKVKDGEQYAIANPPGKDGSFAEQKYKSYCIDGNTGEVFKIIDKRLLDYKDIVPSFEYLFPWLKESTAIYKTHEGISYTFAEWQAYEEKEYEAYCKRTGKPYTPKNQDTRTEKQDTRAKSQDKKSNFIADESEKGDDNTPKKKKDFGDNLLG